MDVAGRGDAPSRDGGTLRAIERVVATQCAVTGLTHGVVDTDTRRGAYASCYAPTPSR